MERALPPSPDMNYPAKDRYLDPKDVASYENDRYGGWLGRHRWRREQRGVGALIRSLPHDLTVLDAPCGNGRWWPRLAERASGITAVDVSEAMRAAAERRRSDVDVPVTVQHGDAEALPFDDGSFDVVFSHALTKHLPLPVQQAVLNEFARVSGRWVLSSFSVVTPLTYGIFRLRRIGRGNLLLPEQLEVLAEVAGLEVVDSRRCGTVLGVERSVLFRKLS